MPGNIIKRPFVVAWTGGHFGLHFLHRKHFYADVYRITDIESQVLNKEVIRYETVFPQLDFHCHSVFHEISLIVGENRPLARPLNHGLLFFGRKTQGFLNQTVVIRDPVACTPFVPAFLSKPRFEELVQNLGCIEPLSACSFLFADLRLMSPGINILDCCRNLIPYPLVVYEQQLMAAKMGMERRDLQGATLPFVKGFFEIVSRPEGWYTGRFIGRVRSVPRSKA